MQQRLLGGMGVGVVPGPGPQHRRLQRPSEGEAQLPGLGAEPVEGVQPCGGPFVGLASGQEHDAGHRGGHGLPQHGDRARRDLLVIGLDRAVRAGQHHVGLEQARLQGDLVAGELVVDRPQCPGGDLSAPRQAVGSVHQDLGFHDRRETRLLREPRISGERMGVRLDTGRRGQPCPDPDHRPPLGEPCTQRGVLRQPLPEPVETFGHHLVREAREGSRARVDLDAGNHALAPEHLDERRPRGVALADRLVEEDHAADELADPGSAEQDLPVGAPPFLGGLQPDGGQPLGHRGRALVSRQDPLAGGSQSPGCDERVR